MSTNPYSDARLRIADIFQDIIQPSYPNFICKPYWNFISGDYPYGIVRTSNLVDIGQNLGELINTYSKNYVILIVTGSADFAKQTGQSEDMTDWISLKVTQYFENLTELTSTNYPTRPTYLQPLVVTRYDESGLKQFSHGNSDVVGTMFTLTVNFLLQGETNNA